MTVPADHRCAGRRVVAGVLARGRCRRPDTAKPSHNSAATSPVILLYFSLIPIIGGVPFLLLFLAGLAGH